MDEKMSFKKKAENFWYYYKYHTLVGAFVLFMAILFIKERIGQIDYDYTVAIVNTGEQVPQEEKEVLQKDLENCGLDINQNGKVDVEVQVYGLSMEEDANPQEVMANQTRFLADIQSGMSMVFLYTDEVESYYKEQNFFVQDEDIRTELFSCAGLINKEEIPSLEGYYISLRTYEDSAIEGKKGMQEYYEDSKVLLERFRKGKDE